MFYETAYGTSYVTADVVLTCSYTLICVTHDVEYSGDNEHWIGIDGGDRGHVTL
jgi:hypothetical protein